MPSAPPRPVDAAPHGTELPAAARICLLRLSALGDVSHVLPLVDAIRGQRPNWELHWVLGQVEARLLAGLVGTTLHAYRKQDGWRGMRRLWAAMPADGFDALCLMQLAFRANLLSLGLRARRRIGYDRARSKEGHGLFIGERIAAHPRGHVLETLMRFAEPLGIAVDELRWDFALSEADLAAAREFVPEGVPTLAISPCSSHRWRNWHAEGYARVAEHAVRQHGLRVILMGGRSAIERETGDAILAASGVPIVDLIGKDTLKQSVAILQRCVALLSPDSGPAHFASAVGTPVIGLYAATDPARSGPYRSLEWCVDRYRLAAQRFRRKEPEELRWGSKIELPGAMDLIEVEAVRERLDALLARPVAQRLAPARLRG